MPRSPISTGISRDGDPRARFLLLHGGRELELKPGQYFIGRNPDSDLFLDDPLVSRTHARIVAHVASVHVEDMKSENGVYVNDHRITLATLLEDGDRVLIGTTELSFCVLTGVDSTHLASGQRLATRPSLAAVPKSARDIASTLEADAFEYLGRIADKMFALGKAATAERMLRGHLDAVLEAARKGEAIDRTVLDQAAIAAMKLATGTSDPRWVHYALELHVIFAVPLCSPAVDMLRDLLPRLPPTSRPLVAGYQRALVASFHRLGPEDSERARRIVALDVR